MGNWKWCIGARAPRVFRCFHFPSHSVIYLGRCGFSRALSHPLARILARLLVLTYYSHLVLCVCERVLSSIYNWISTVLHRTYAANAIVYRPIRITSIQIPFQLLYFIRDELHKEREKKMKILKGKSVHGYSARKKKKKFQVSRSTERQSQNSRFNAVRRGTAMCARGTEIT